MVKPASTKTPASKPATPTKSQSPRASPPVAGRPLNQKPKALPNTNTAAKQTALDKLRSLIGGKNSIGSPAAPKSSPDTLHKTAVGDSKIPEARRVYLYIRRPAQTYKDAITNTEQKRPAKTAAVYYDRDTPVGRVVDMAGVNLGLKGTKLKLGPDTLEPGVPISKFAGKTLDIF